MGSVLIILYLFQGLVRTHIYCSTVIEYESSAVMLFYQ